MPKKLKKEKNYKCELAAGHGVQGRTRMTKEGWLKLCETTYKNESKKARGKYGWNKISKGGASSHTCDNCKLGKARWEKGKDVYPDNVIWIELD